MPPEDRLAALLIRAQRAAEIAKQTALKARLKNSARARERQRAKEARAATEISEDFAQRLLERGRIRRALTDDPLDAERFRWYFSKFGNNLESARIWIDERMQEKTRVG